MASVVVRAGNRQLIVDSCFFSINQMQQCGDLQREPSSTNLIQISLSSQKTSQRQNYISRVPQSRKRLLLMSQ